MRDMRKRLLKELRKEELREERERMLRERMKETGREEKPSIFDKMDSFGESLNRMFASGREYGFPSLVDYRERKKKKSRLEDW